MMKETTGNSGIPKTAMFKARSLWALFFGLLSAGKCILLGAVCSCIFHRTSAIYSLQAINQATGRLLRKRNEAPLGNTLRNAVNVLNRAAAL